MKRGLCYLGFIACALCCVGETVRADVKLPNVIGSNMVLQRDLDLPIWGKADPGEKVTVAIAGQTVSGDADANGRWSVKLAKLKDEGPHEMTVTGKNEIKLTNILVGEVWVGSGQSNMQMSVQQSLNGAEEIKTAKHSKIRLFLVPLVPSGTPADDVNTRWVECSPETIPGFSAVLYFFGREIHQQVKAPVGLIATSWGGTRIEPWIPPAGFAAVPELKGELDGLNGALKNYDQQLKAAIPALKGWVAKAEAALAANTEIPAVPNVPNHPLNNNGAATGLYNGMVHGIVPFGIRGSLWYQGESNRGQRMHYYDLMKGLIGGWRKVWGQGDFPFLFVQLAPYNYGNDPNHELAFIWEAQAATLKVPNTGMAVLTDITTVNDIHPPNKQDVGKRLALWALAQTYGQKDVIFSGPLYDSMSDDLENVVIKFKHGTGLKSRDGKPLTWFTIAGADKKFHKANAEIKGDTVIVSSPDVAKPVAVRFGWHQLAEPNLVNKAGLPASPFRTDNWSDAIPASP